MSLAELHEDVIYREVMLKRQIQAKTQLRSAVIRMVDRIVLLERLLPKLPNETSRKAARRSEDDEN